MRQLIPILAAVPAIIVGFYSAHAQPPAPTGKAAPKGAVDGRLSWFDRQGKVVGSPSEKGTYRTLTVSPDGKQAAFERTDPQTQNRDIWLLDFASGKERRFTSDPGWEAFPTWSPDGRQIVFTSNRGGVYDLYRKPVSGETAEELLYKSADGKGPTSWSPDGRYLLYYTLGQPTHVRLLPVNGPAERQPTAVVDPMFSSITARFSPDGKWIAYTSNEFGESEVAVRPFDAATGSIGKAVVLTSDGGRTPLWRRDGKELFYLTRDGMATALEINTKSGIKSGKPKPLFKIPSGVVFWDVAPDGTRFLMPSPNS